MKKVKLLLGIHNHQPLGNFDSVIEEAYNRSYLPFIEVLEKYPAVKMSLHYSGTLLDWLTDKKPHFITKIRNLIQKKQVELIGGAYYEAILSAIPDADKFDQLSKMNDTLTNLFMKSPRGAWLAERVWEQHLAKHLAQAGLEFTILDDTHFKYAGFSEDDLFGYYKTEDSGLSVSVFPINKALRYSIPFRAVQETIDYLIRISNTVQDAVVVYADDGEKFGAWPKTFHHVYTEGWLENFFKALSNHSDSIEIVHFSEVIDNTAPLGRTYLPNASYAEMMHWALPVQKYGLFEESEAFLRVEGKYQRYESFFKGGFWRNFLVKYPESNHMNKRMLRVSNRLRKWQSDKETKSETEIDDVRESVLAAQCNDAYWHGIFGGLYLPNLRYPIYRSIIKAEKALDKLEQKNDATVEVSDFDCDGHDEVIVETPHINVYLRPRFGGMMSEFDLKGKSLNILDILSRREEGYHAKLRESKIQHAESKDIASIHDITLSKESNLHQYLQYDNYQRGSLIDHFFLRDTSITNLLDNSEYEAGDFINASYDILSETKRETTYVTLTREGNVTGFNGKSGRIKVSKVVEIHSKENDITIHYDLMNLDRNELDIWFGVEFNYGLQAGDAPDRYYYLDERKFNDSRLRSSGLIEKTKALGLRDEWLGVDIRLEMEQPTDFWRFPIETISLSESGLERVFQSSVVIPHWKLRLDKEWKVTIRQRVSEI